ncbi:MAG TPA: radical SAM protein, partial [Dehalococcoidia bacterium]|nr:radical SAM protein [Dehalococcoidia bacterium]
MLYFAAVAEEAGLSARLIDLMLERLTGDAAVQFVESCVDAGADEVWIGIRLSIPTLPQDLAFANALKDRFPHARVFAIGGVIMGTYRHWIHQCRLDFLVYGEPEAVMGDVFRAEDWRQAPGIIVVDAYEPDGRDPFDPATAVDYIKWKRVPTLTVMPKPAWHLVPIHRYSASGRSEDAYGKIQGSRGCPIACTMCAYTMLEGGPLRISDATRVVDEIEYLQKQYGITHFSFEDPNFAYDRRLLKSIVAEMKQRGLHIDAAAELSLELLDRSTLESMYEAGIRTLLTGVETADEACMKSIGQNIKVNPLIQQKLKWCEEIGIKVYTFFLIGAPEESWDTIRRTIAFAKELGSESTLTLMTPFPGTP